MINDWVSTLDTSVTIFKQKVQSGKTAKQILVQNGVSATDADTLITNYFVEAALARELGKNKYFQHLQESERIMPNEFNYVMDFLPRVPTASKQAILNFVKSEIQTVGNDPNNYLESKQRLVSFLTIFYQTIALGEIPTNKFSILPSQVQTRDCDLPSILDYAILGAGVGAFAGSLNSNGKPKLDIKPKSLASLGFTIGGSSANWLTLGVYAVVGFVVGGIVGTLIECWDEIWGGISSFFQNAWDWVWGNDRELNCHNPELKFLHYVGCESAVVYFSNTGNDGGDKIIGTIGNSENGIPRSFAIPRGETQLFRRISPPNNIKLFFKNVCSDGSARPDYNFDALEDFININGAVNQKSKIGGPTNVTLGAQDFKEYAINSNQGTRRVISWNTQDCRITNFELTGTSSCKMKFRSPPVGCFPSSNIVLKALIENKCGSQTFTYEETLEIRVNFN
jgi:hypothetical protein